MNDPSLVLLVSENPAVVHEVREIVATRPEQINLQHIERARTAAARLAGGGVTTVLLDISSSQLEHQARDAFSLLRGAAQAVPIVVLCEPHEEALAGQMVEEGAHSYLLRPRWAGELKERLAAATTPARMPSAGRGRVSARKGKVIAVWGAKGGVGATTVAANVAAIAAGSAPVILAELRPPFGTLCHLFRPPRAARGLQNLIALPSGNIGVDELAACLWPNRAIPGLSVLFAGDKLSEGAELSAGQARQIVERAAELAEWVVLDLPPLLSQIEQAALASSEVLALVVERDALCVDVAKTKLNVMEQHSILPQETGLVIVNRVALASPMALPDIESQLGLPILAVIPPAADLCAAAYRVRTPLVKLDADSLAGTSFVHLAKKLSGHS